MEAATSRGSTHPLHGLAGCRSAGSVAISGGLPVISQLTASTWVLPTAFVGKIAADICQLSDLRAARR